jgi:hypothetical protein
MKKKLKGATLIEAIVSMIIMALVFVIFVMIYTNVMVTDDGPGKLKAMSLVNKVVSETKATRQYNDTIFKENNLTVVRVINQSAGAQGVFVLSVKVKRDSNNVLALYNEICRDDERKKDL